VGVDKVNPSYILGGPDSYSHILADLAEGVPSRLIDTDGIHVIVHFAAQSHVDVSIRNPISTVMNNVAATQNVLELARHFDARLIHISTDEVFGSLDDEHDPLFTVESQYRPNSPYSASKAACDHLVRSYRQTYGLNATTINCTNNFGPHQAANKFIPKTIQSLMLKNPIHIYGDGSNIRDWIHVDDFCSFIWTVMNSSHYDESIVVGAKDCLTNNQIVEQIIDHYETLSGYRGLRRLMNHVADRPGHDFRYSVDNYSACSRWNWKPQKSVDKDLRSTVKWYLDNDEWFER